jgi:hypothetical protein
MRDEMEFSLTLFIPHPRRAQAHQAPTSSFILSLPSATG